MRWVDYFVIFCYVIKIAIELSVVVATLKEDWLYAMYYKYLLSLIIKLNLSFWSMYFSPKRVFPHKFGIMVLFV